MIARSSNGGDKMYRIPGLLYNNNNGHRNVSLPFIVNYAIVWFTLMQLTSFTWWTLAGSDMSNIVEIWHLHSFTIDLSSVVCMYVCGYVCMSLRLQSHRSTKNFQILAQHSISKYLKMFSQIFEKLFFSRVIALFLYFFKISL